VNEDHQRNRKDHGPENIGLLRRWASSLATKGSMKRKFKRAERNGEFPTRLLSHFAKGHIKQRDMIAPANFRLCERVDHDGRADAGCSSGCHIRSEVSRLS
jgi:hypothetical protein